MIMANVSSRMERLEKIMGDAEAARTDALKREADGQQLRQDVNNVLLEHLLSEGAELTEDGKTLIPSIEAPDSLRFAYEKYPGMPILATDVVKDDGTVVRDGVELPAGFEMPDKF
jgi:hypothetical protein